MTPLEVELAALNALLGETSGDRRALLETTLRHEREYWDEKQSVWEEGDLHPTERVMAAITLLGGCDTGAPLKTLVRDVSGYPEARAELTGKLAQRIVHLYGADGLDSRPRVTPLRPDLLGEYLILMALGREGSDGGSLLARVLDRACDEQQLSSVLTVLHRLAQHELRAGVWMRRAIEARFPDSVRPAMLAAQRCIATEATRPIERMLLEVLEARGTPDLARRLRDGFPPATAVLADVAVWLMKTIVPEDRSLAGQDTASKKDAAFALLQLSDRLRMAGRLSDALATVEDAVRACREACEADPGYRCQLAQGLRLTGDLRKLCCDDRAAAAAWLEAFEILSDLDRLHPGVFEGRLVRCMLAAYEVGRAPDLTDDAVAYYRGMIRRDSENRLDLELRFAEVLRCAGRLEESRQTLVTAIYVCGQLAEQDRDRYSRPLILGQMRLAHVLHELGSSEAVEAAREAVVLARALHKRQPELGWVFLFETLRVAAETASPAEALVLLEEAAALPLPRPEDEHQVRDLAQAHRRLATTYSVVGELGKARVQALRAAELLRPLTGSAPLRHGVDFALAQLEVIVLLEESESVVRLEMAAEAWKVLRQVERLRSASGTTDPLLAPGREHCLPRVSAQGSKDQAVVIRFAQVLETCHARANPAREAGEEPEHFIDRIRRQGSFADMASVGLRSWMQPGKNLHIAADLLSAEERMYEAMGFHELATDALYLEALVRAELARSDPSKARSAAVVFHRLATAKGRGPVAIEALRQSVRFFDLSVQAPTCGDARHRAVVLADLTMRHVEMESFAEAVDSAREAIATFLPLRNQGDTLAMAQIEFTRYWEAYALKSLGEPCRALESATDALSCHLDFWTAEPGQGRGKLEHLLDLVDELTGVPGSVRVPAGLRSSLSSVLDRAGRVEPSCSARVASMIGRLESLQPVHGTDKPQVSPASTDRSGPEGT
ncbi:MAG: hypothetical protein HY815_31330 [Candidatus Riflebacteria bacterium]|nr:hypothetical protein [Candidatus Riflebacteria bacterium]